MKKAKEIKDDKFYVKENDIDAIRRRPTMIIGTLNAKVYSISAKKSLTITEMNASKSILLVTRLM